MEKGEEANYGQFRPTAKEASQAPKAEAAREAAQEERHPGLSR